MFSQNATRYLVVSITGENNIRGMDCMGDSSPRGHEICSFFSGDSVFERNGYVESTRCVRTNKHYNSQPAGSEDAVNNPNLSYQLHEDTIELVNDPIATRSLDPVPQ